MAWIRTIPEAEAEGSLAEIYKHHVDSEMKIVDHILTVHSLRPDILDAHLRLYRAVMWSPGGLARRERELIAVAVSAWNRCRY